MSAPFRRLLILALLMPAAAIAADLPSPDVSSTLAIQDALRQGRDLLQRGKAKDAVELLEAQLPFINGNSSYLSVLREAYGEWIKSLQLEHRDELAADVQRRLAILEKRQPVAKARASVDDDPLQQSPRRGSPTSEGSLAAAEKAFAENRYRDANDMFAKAFTENPGLSKTHGGPWAYCKLFVVHERLKATPDLTVQALSDLELDVSLASNMAPVDDSKLATIGKQLQEEIRARKPVAPTVAVAVSHLDRGNDGWARAESPNFRLLHVQARERAEQIVRAAEQARSSAIRKWSGSPGGAWKPVCEIYLYATAADYAKATGKSDAAPGHATFQVQNGAVIRRRLDLRADEPNLVTHTLPHEATHLVLADLFADAPLPRWADEGMAVLAEPRSQFERYVRTLHRCRAQSELVPLAQLLKQADYPETKQITAFYVESVSLVEFLLAEREPKVLVQFLRESGRGLDAALAKHYGCNSVADLQDRWLRKTFAPAGARGSAEQ